MTVQSCQNFENTFFHANFHTVIQNFGFSHRNIPFWKSTETSDYSTDVLGATNETFDSVSTTLKFRFWLIFFKVYRYETSWFPPEYFRHLPMSDTSPKFCIFSLKSVVDFEPKKSWVRTPNRPQRMNKKTTFYQAIRNQNLIFNGFNLESTTETSGQNFVRDFERPNKNIRNSFQSFGWAETGETLEVSGEN
jgi:hypothetical protein